MSYHALTGKPETSSSSEDLPEDCQPPTFSNHQNKQLKRVWRLSIANLALLGIQLIFLAAHVSRGWLPSKVKYIEGTYGFDTKYMTLDHAYDWLWEDRAIQRAGAVAVMRNEEDEVTEYGVISMFHQLHCVGSLRKALQNAYEGGHVAFDQNQDPHWPHCLHYLHQMIVCKADGQIEKQETWNFTLPFISGAEDVRQCGNSKTLFELFEAQGA